jgi:hypothetical protein
MNSRIALRALAPPSPPDLPRHDFDSLLQARGLALPPLGITTLQVNITKMCNQVCRHCHVDASPTRTEALSRAGVERCVELLAPALGDPDVDVKRALSFALRLSARGNPSPVRSFIMAHQEACDTHSLWVLCDVIRSMARTLLPEFVVLLPVYRAWLGKAEPQARRSVEAAVRLLAALA